jgi:hypothetical protein
METEILLACVVTMLLLLVEHWFPWRLMLRRDLPRLAAYVLGVLALAGPLTALFVRWKAWMPLAGLWSVIVSGGLAVMVAYGVDWLLGRLALAVELGELMTSPPNPLSGAERGNPAQGALDAQDALEDEWEG